MFHPWTVTYLMLRQQEFLFGTEKAEKGKPSMSVFLMHGEIFLLVCEQNIFGEFICLNNPVDTLWVTSLRAVHYTLFMKHKCNNNMSV